MELVETLLFIIFPYVCLTTFVVGHAFRYLTDRYSWNVRSSEFLEKKNLFYGSVLFHWGIVFTFLGHAGGLLIPQTIFDLVGIDSRAHLFIAYWTGLVLGLTAFSGALILLFRRLTNPRLRTVGTKNDTLTIGGLVLVIAAGLYNVFFGHYDVLNTIAPWIRGIVTLTPDVTLMREVPLGYRIHILGALALLAFSPFSRLVHIWSVPVTYFIRRWIIFRKMPGGPGGTL